MLRTNLDEHRLLHVLRENANGGGPQDTRMMNELRRLKHAGKPLRWVMIPELIPGTASTRQWIKDARNLLWDEDDEKAHLRQQRLLQPGALDLPHDEYQLRKYWPLFMCALRPMSPKLSEAANAVYQALCRKDCVPDDDDLFIRTMETDTRHGQFIVAALALESKILYPIISELEAKIGKSGKKLKPETATSQSQNNTQYQLSIQPLVDTMPMDFDPGTNEIDEETLLKLLKSFADELLAEKLRQDGTINSKRPAPATVDDQWHTHTSKRLRETVEDTNPKAFIPIEISCFDQDAPTILFPTLEILTMVCYLMFPPHRSLRMHKDLI
ncbi:hypothetical protein BU24DRAFT_404153 [Aaosphaeria arxii CBS 175.79]|uniref:Uncharacterized protein n=1 Tax=Aaosphaeria arxii CBS 175.79 TaxID=1450172 RepID=A0A6A5Y938_9PLEO|nr:uncharacterized protein BU24DRAFT_404153 [Aaosphaeria arxii CBS 175.79]KAF2021104.1 hypothetical protein BU24DRAFT_404153 [Aaosphaeria arxii CBS 175.79]